MTDYRLRSTMYVSMSFNGRKAFVKKALVRLSKPDVVSQSENMQPSKQRLQEQNLGLSENLG